MFLVTIWSNVLFVIWYYLIFARRNFISLSFVIIFFLYLCFQRKTKKYGRKITLEFWFYPFWTFDMNWRESLQNMDVNKEIFTRNNMENGLAMRVRVRDAQNLPVASIFLDIRTIDVLKINMHALLWKVKTNIASCIGIPLVTWYSLYCSVTYDGTKQVRVCMEMTHFYYISYVKIEKIVPFL